MPSGYTGIIDNGPVDFKEFALRCARAFGAVISMRELSLETPIPEVIKPIGTYHSDALARLKEKRSELVKKSDDELKAEAFDAYKAELKRIEKMNKESLAKRKCANALVLDVQEWEPPTPEHVRMKEFMLEQIEEYLKYDCQRYPAPLVPRSADFKRDRYDALGKEIMYHEDALKAEQEQAKKATAWVQALRDSLK